MLDPTADEWLETLIYRQCAATTIRNYRQTLGRLQSRSPRLISEWSTEQLAQLLGDNYTLAHHQVLSAFYGWMCRRRLRPDNPAKELGKPKTATRLPRRLRRPELERLLSSLGARTADQRRTRALVFALYYGGLRAGEAAGLDWEAIDFNAGTMRVYGKGRKERLLPVPAPLAEALQSWESCHPTGTGAVFVSNRRGHERLAYHTIQGLLKEAIQAAGLPAGIITPHGLRHTYATNLNKAGVPITSIQKLLGHTKLSTTLHYAATSIDLATRAAINDL